MLGTAIAAVNLFGIRSASTVGLSGLGFSPGHFLLQSL
jgi:hypothetical protein